MTTKKKLLDTIHEKCVECIGKKDVINCTSGHDASPYAECPLWDYRMGTDGTPSVTRVKRGKKLNDKE